MFYITVHIVGASDGLFNPLLGSSFERRDNLLLVVCGLHPAFLVRFHAPVS